jgi:hypothetical protein
MLFTTRIQQDRTVRSTALLTRRLNFEKKFLIFHEAFFFRRIGAARFVLLEGNISQYLAHISIARDHGDCMVAAPIS